MPSRTDDPPRTKFQPPPPAPASPLVRSPATPPDHPLTHEAVRAFFSSQQRGGRWEPADEIEVLAVAGDVTLDFTRAALPPSGEIEIDATSLAGNIEIILPDGAEVEIDVTPILGSVEQQTRKKGAGVMLREWVTGTRDEDFPASPPSTEPAFFRIEGRAILGTIKVTGR